MSQVEKIVVLNFDSRYMQAARANVSLETKALDEIRILGRKEYSGITTKGIISEESFENEVGQMIEIVKLKNLNKIYIGTPSSLTKIHFEKRRKTLQKPTLINQEMIDQMANEVIAQNKSQDYTVISTSTSYINQENKIVSSIVGQTAQDFTVNFSLVLLDNKFLEKVKNVLLSKEVIESENDIEFISQDQAEFLTIFDERERDSSVIICSIDDLTTTVSIGRGDAIIAKTSTDLGISYIETEIYSQFGLPEYKDAANILRQTHILQDPKKQFYKIKYNDMNVDFPCDGPISITKQKLDEIATFIRRAIQNSRFDLPSHIIVSLIGTNAYELVGIEEYLSIQVNKKVQFVTLAMNRSKPEVTGLMSVLKLASLCIETNKKQTGKLKKFINKLFKK